MIIECIPEYTNADAWAELAFKYGLSFEYNEFFNPEVLDSREKTDEIISIYKGLERDTSNDTLHGAFLDITVASSDPLIKKASDYRVCQSLDIASRLGVRGVVFHTNYLTDFKSNAYRNNWVEKNTEYWTQICSKYDHLDIYMENMFDDTPELLLSLANRMKETANFGVCLDLAHAFLSKLPVTNWVSVLSPHIRHIHINDNDKEQDLHLPVGSGKMDWSILFSPDLIASSPSMLIEVTGQEKLEKSYAYMKTLGFQFKEGA